MALLYVDVLNFGRWFFPPKDMWDVDQGSSQVASFVSAAQNSGLKLRAFIDASIQTEETMAKWRSRREKEVRSMKRDMPQGLSALLGEMFQSQGVDMHYSVDRDNDDTLAFFAEADGADILSEDSDFFRYTGSTFRLFKGFYIRRGRMQLVPHEGRLKPGVKERPLEPTPCTIATMPAFIDVSRKGTYTRGTPSPLVKQMGNPHLTARPLRCALYARLSLGAAGGVREEFPVWDGVRVIWDVQPDVLPDGSLDHLLEDPKRALVELFPQLFSTPPSEVPTELWAKHVFAVHAVVLELCCTATGSSFLLAMSQHRSQIRSIAGIEESNFSVGRTHHHGKGTCGRGGKGFGKRGNDNKGGRGKGGRGGTGTASSARSGDP